MHVTLVHTMAEEENVVGELHGHFDQALRTALSGGLQITEHRARRRQQEAEAERLSAKDVARQLEARKRAEIEANALVVQQRIAADEAERAERSAVGEETERNAERVGEGAAPSTPTAFPSTIGETLARARPKGSERAGGEPEHTAKARHQRERGAAKTTAELGR